MILLGLGDWAVFTVAFIFENGHRIANDYLSEKELS
jgi:hypothetical protein